MRPESRGFVRIASADPHAFPAIQPNYLDHPADRSVLIAALKTARRLFETRPLARYLDAEVFPGTEVQSDDEWLAFAKQYGGSSNHAVGTCKMGPKSDPFAVVDHELKVHGVEGLHVIDASIMPAMVSANTHAAALMIGEKGADLVLGRSFALVSGL
jgi:choline dehydrogenase